MREHVESNRALVLQRIEALVRWAIERSGIPADLDVELGARTIRCLSEEAGRMLLTDPEQYSPERYERFSRADDGAHLGKRNDRLNTVGTRFQGSPPSILTRQHPRPG